MKQEKKYLEEIKKILEKELGLEMGDMKSEKVYENGQFKEYKLKVSKSDGSGVYVIHDGIVRIDDV